MQREYRFTLIELLVVISVVCILVALLLPTLSKAKEKSLEINCVSILKNLGNISTMYESDNVDYIVPAIGSTQNWYEIMSIYDNRLFMRETSISVPLCPKNSQEQGLIFNIGSVMTFDTSAGAENVLMGGYSRFISTENSLVSALNSTYTKIVSIKNISHKVNLFEAYYGILVLESSIINAPSVGASAWLRHGNNKINSLFFDGHVGSIERNNLLSSTDINNYFSLY